MEENRSFLPDKKEKIFKITLLLLLLILAFYLAFLGFYKLYDKGIYDKENNKTEEKDNHFKVEGINFNHCKNENDDRCKYSNNTLRYLDVDVSYPKIKEVEKEINEIVSKKYNEILQSNLERIECMGVKDVYNYSSIYMMAEYLYETNNLISIAYELSGIDVCTEQPLERIFHSYVYDINRDNFLTKDELLELYNVNSSDVEEAITDNISSWNNFLSTNYSYYDISNDYDLYISSDGSLNVFYTNSVTNDHYTTLIKQINIE